MSQYVVVFPSEAYGPFESQEDAKDFLLRMFGYDETEMRLDHTWSIKPLNSP